MVPATIPVLATGFGAARMWPNPVDVDAIREELTTGMRAELEDAKVTIERLQEAYEGIHEMLKLSLNPDLRDREEFIEEIGENIELAEEVRRRMVDETKTKKRRSEEKP